MRNVKPMILASLFAAFLWGCGTKPTRTKSTAPVSITVHAEDFRESSQKDVALTASIEIFDKGWLSYEVYIPLAGRYKIAAHGVGGDGSSIWVEDYIDNTDGRTLNITGDMAFSDNKLKTIEIDGAPLNAGVHKMKFHAKGGAINLDWIKFTLLTPHRNTPKTLTQNMAGTEWQLVWSDEFDGAGLPDTTKWSYDVGNWGWGNNEPQYYTNKRQENARQENGALMIEARKNDMGQPWTSARLTTAGKQSFLYGKIEFRAKVPVGRGTWSAGWLLGDAYRDEISWPYCGEIDVLECVGYEINDTTGDGKNHASCHTKAFNFKQKNQITAAIDVEKMNSEWHTYTLEWYPNVIYISVDGTRFYTYDKTADELEWPFGKPQNIILNLAVGGGWGGKQGIDESWENHQLLIDYVRVYETVNSNAK